MGDYSRAAEMLRGNVEVLARSTPADVRFYCIYSQSLLAQVLSLLGKFVEGRRHGEEAVRLAMVDGQWHRDIRISTRERLGHLYLAQGDLEAAIQVFAESLALCRASGQRVSLGSIAGGLGEAYAHTGRLAEGPGALGGGAPGRSPRRSVGRRYGGMSVSKRNSTGGSSRLARSFLLPCGLSTMISLAEDICGLYRSTRQRTARRAMSQESG